MNGWAPKSELKSGLSAIGASQSNVQVSNEFRLTAGGASQALAIVVKLSGFSGTVTAAFETGTGDYWESVSTGIAMASGYNVIRYNMPTNAADMPFLAKGRILLSTAAASGCTVDDVQIIQEL